MPTHTIKLPPGKMSQFCELFLSKAEQAEHRQEQKATKKRAWLIGGKTLPIIKDPLLATEFDHALSSARVQNIDASLFHGSYEIDKSGAAIAELSLRVSHPGLIARIIIETTSNDRFHSFYRVECRESNDATIVTCRRYGAALDKIGCVFTLVFGFFTLIIGGIIFYLSYRKGPKMAERINDALADALRKRLT